MSACLLLFQSWDQQDSTEAVALRLYNQLRPTGDAESTIEDLRYESQDITFAELVAKAKALAVYSTHPASEPPLSFMYADTKGRMH